MIRMRQAERGLSRGRLLYCDRITPNTTAANTRLLLCVPGGRGGRGSMRLGALLQDCPNPCFDAAERPRCAVNLGNLVPATSAAPPCHDAMNKISELGRVKPQPVGDKAVWRGCPLGSRSHRRTGHTDGRHAHTDAHAFSHALTHTSSHNIPSFAPLRPQTGPLESSIVQRAMLVVLSLFLRFSLSSVPHAGRTPFASSVPRELSAGSRQSLRQPTCLSASVAVQAPAGSVPGPTHAFLSAFFIRRCRTTHGRENEGKQRLGTDGDAPQKKLMAPVPRLSIAYRMDLGPRLPWPP